MSELRTDFKDEILQEGETHRVYNIKRKGTDEVVESEVYLEKAYEALQEGDEFGAKDVNEIHVRLNGLASMNLLINGDFRNPVNQRGQTSYTLDASARTYTIDRWYSANAIKVVLEDDGIHIYNTGSQTYGYLLQYIETPLIVGEKYTISAKINGVIYSHTFIAGEGFNTTVPYFTYDPVSDSLAYDRIGLRIEGSYLVEYIKLEQGSVATPLVPRPYGEELALCQRYYQTYNGRLLMGIYNKDYADGQYYFPVEMRTDPTVTFISCDYYDNSLGWVVPQSIELSAYHNSKYISCRLQRGSNDTFSLGLTINSRLDITIDAEIY